MRIFENANYNIIGSRQKAYVVSGVLLLVSVLALVFHGLEVGIDFRGGMEFVVASDAELAVGDVRATLTQALGYEPSEVKTYGEDGLLIRTVAEEGADITAVQNQIVSALATAYPDASPTMEKTDIVGPRFAEDLKWGAIWSVLGSLLVIFVYILIRFEWQYGLGAVAALFHDVAITLGIFSLLHGFVPFSLQIDQTIIAAFLTIVGYSINDTVVVFDRIREYTNLFKTDNFPDIANRSINNTLSRTIITSGTTLLVVVVLFIFGGEVLRGFAFAIIVGICIGTYSSIFVASPIVVELRERAAARAVAARK